MSEENETEQFSPVIYKCRYPSLTFHVTTGFDKKDEPITEEWQFTNGVFVCDTPEKAAVVEEYLDTLRKNRQSAVAGLFERTDRESALKVAMDHRKQISREGAAVAGPFQADNMISRSAEAAEHRALQEGPEANNPNTAAAITAGLAALLNKVAASKVEENTTEAAPIPPTE